MLPVLSGDFSLVFSLLLNSENLALNSDMFLNFWVCRNEMPDCGVVSDVAVVPSFPGLVIGFKGIRKLYAV